MDLIDDRTVPEDHRSGYVALVGRPNVGKSTLLNRILGQKISIVTEKPQTTRHRVLGIRSQEDAQIIFLDTPGLIDPRYGLHRAMMHVAKGAIDEADLVIYLADARDEKPRGEVLRHLEGHPTLLAVNKTDLVEEEKAESLIAAHREQRSFADALPISALTGYRVEELVDRIVEEFPSGPPLYPRDLISEHPERFFVAEIVREKIFERFREEIPYSTQVNIVAFEERSEGKDFIDAEVVVERSSQKGMLIGKQGKAIKAIGEAARKDVEEFLQREVYLQLHVKVEENWRDRPNYLSRVGLTGRGTKRGF